MKRIEPQPGQESVWDYPRPPRLEATPKHLVIKFNGVIIAETRNGYRVLETSHPPVYYFPPQDVRAEYMKISSRTSYCEWKGRANYCTIEVNGKKLVEVGWMYQSPTTAFSPIAGYFAFYAGPMEECLVDGEKVTPQPGEFYGGWITADVVGPFKGSPGTWGW
jgi:uncharacterized protein (DUF427 family)